MIIDCQINNTYNNIIDTLETVNINRSTISYKI